MAELAAGAFLTSLFQILFDRMESLEIVHFFKGQKLNHGLLKKLKVTMITVNGLLDHAEEKQITIPAVKEWLHELKDAVYKADDLLDEIAYEALRSKLEVQSPAQKVRNLFSSHYPFKLKVNAKLEEILGLLEHLVKQMDALGLSMRKGIGEIPSSLKIPTTSLSGNESSIFGRNNDKEAIIRSLLSDDYGVRLVCIAGISGMGKTTLAQLVYSDNKVKEWFDLKSWVYVSEEFDMSKIMKDIYKEIDNSENSNIKTLNEFCSEIKKKLAGKKFLLVMDDVWNDKYSVWGILRECLQTGAQGSKIMITTRVESTASALHSQNRVHRLKRLSDGDCWFLFAKNAFDDDDSSSASLHLETIGREIVKKCQGLPLAAKTIGSLLRFKRDFDEWKRLLLSSIWDLVSDNILPALKLSYHYLPSHLKRCFAYCAIFPKGYQFYKHELILLWIAEGFIVPCKGNNDIEMESVGNEYFNDLVSRSFFQHVMAHFVDSNEFRSIDECLQLRTFLFIKPHGFSFYADKKVTYDSLLLLKCLRVLSLSDYSIATELPDSIGSLIHLRFLNLSEASIKRLPESVCNLYHLQSLILFHCQNLTELPTKMGKLINLCYLDIRETKLRKMPPEMSKLTELRMLTNFIMGKRSSSSIKELRKLHHLSGDLSIQNLENVVDPRDAHKANLRFKKQLQKLELKWDGETKDSDNVRSTLELLEPHVNLEFLCIVGYGCIRFPSWVGDSSFSNLISLKLSNSKNCLWLPSLGQLASLKDLSITAFDRLRSIGPHFYCPLSLRVKGNMRKSFQSLEILRFERMPQWYMWTDEDGAFSQLRELYIKECPHLTKALPNHLPSLATLVIEGCQELNNLLPKGPMIREVRLKDSSRSMALVKLSSGLYSLRADRCHFVDVLKPGGQMQDLFNSLEDVEISNDSLLECFLLESFPNLKRIAINRCPNLESISAAEVASSSSLEFRNLSNLMQFCSKFPPIQLLNIRDCEKLPVVSLPVPETLQQMVLSSGRNLMQLDKLPSGLFSLSVCQFNLLVMEHLPGVFATLQVIKITKCNTLECFLQELFPRIKTLMIENCPNLESFSGPKAASLEEISILNCQKLQLLLLPKASTISLADKNRHLNSQKLPSGLYSLQVSKFHLLEEIEMWLISFTNASEITITDCDPLNCFLLELFPKLGSLTISHCPNFKSLSASDQSPHQEFPSLNFLTINDCRSFISFSQGLRAPNLTTLYLWECLNLKSLPDHMHSFLPSLTELELNNCPELGGFPKGGLPSKLEALKIQSCKKFPSLPSYSASNYVDLDSFTEEGLLPSTLTHLTLWDLQNLKSVDYMGLIHLTDLVIRNCPNLQSFPECMEAILPSLMRLEIYNCPELRLFLNGGLPFKLQSLDISNSSKLISGLMQLDLRNLPSLTAIRIAVCESAETFKEEMFPSVLTSLQIHGLEKLKSLRLQHLICLKTLEIRDCLNLQALPKEGLPSSLSCLVISNCPLLKQKVKMEDGQIWDMIYHIPNICIDDVLYD